MNYGDYFQNVQGFGVLATADAKGEVNTAVYSRPHSLGDDEVGFIMANRRSLGNVKENGHASFLFMEEGQGYKGRRLALTKLREETNPEILDSLRLRRGQDNYEKYKGLEATLVVFRVTEDRPLIGDGREGR